MMTLSLEKSLAVLHDVPGVDGAFVLDELGVLLARDAAFPLPEPILAGAASRIATLIEAATEGFEAPRELTLVFATHRLVLRALSPCVLAVLARTGASAEAVRMASNIALRQIVRQLAGGGAPSAPALRGAVAAAAPSSSRIALTPAVSARPAPPGPQRPAPAPAPKKKPKNDIWG